jgi:hypothetical protein
MSDPVNGNDPAGQEEVTISFNPVSEGVPNVSTRASGDDYHGDPDDEELGDPNVGDEEDNPDLAAGRSEDVAISYFRVLLYDRYTGELKKNFATEVESPGGLPVIAQVFTGRYDVAFIINEKSDSQTGGLPTFLADEENYNLLRKLENALIHNSAFNSAPNKNIPMYQVVRDVYIKGINDLEVGGAPVDSPWAPMITRAGVRVSLDILLRPDQFSSWTSKEVKISGITPSSHLIPYQFNPWPDNGNTLVSRTWSASTTDGSPGLIEDVTVDGSPMKRVRYDRLILPEHTFSDRTNADKALVLSMTINGREMKGFLTLPDPLTSNEGYTLPRNTWLHMNVSVASTKLNVHPVVVNWNDRSIAPPVIDAFDIRVPDPVYISGSGGDEVFQGTYAETDIEEMAGTVRRSNTTDGTDTPDWIGDTGISFFQAESGRQGFNGRLLNTLPNLTGSDRVGYVNIKVGNPTEGWEYKMVRIIQRPAMVFAPPGVIGIRKSDLDRLQEVRKALKAGYIREGKSETEAAAQAAKYFDPDISPTIKGSSTYASTDWIGQIALDEGLDGLENEPVYALYFKWGSTVAMIGGVNDSWSVDDVVWVNPEFASAHPEHDFSSYASFTHADVTGTQGEGNNVKENLPAGHGDPCDFVNGGTNARPSGWKTPIGNPWRSTRAHALSPTGHTIFPFGTTPESISTYTAYTTLIKTGVANGQAVASLDKNIFLPATGMRSTTYSNPGDGDMGTGTTSPLGYYWSSTKYNSGDVNSFYLGLFVDGKINPSSTLGSANGFAVRCMPPVQVADAVPGTGGEGSRPPQAGMKAPTGILGSITSAS